MKAVSTTEFDMDFPSKNYRKYQSQSKTNPLLQKVNQDVGYPQDVLNQTHNQFPSRNSKNYLQLNKKNLKNFFADRLPPKDTEIARESYTIDPSKLFQIKKRQHQLKAVTRAKLDEKLEAKQRQTKLNSMKITNTFQLNDKNQDFKKKFLGNDNFRVSEPYQQNNHLKGTSSFIQKYSRITKKNAYNSVFGPEMSATTRKSVTARGYRQQASFSRPYTTTRGRNDKKYKVNSASKQMERNKFSSLIQKIDQHRQSLDPQNIRGMKPYVPSNDLQDNQASKNEMITWIRDTALSFKYHSVDSHNSRITNIEDISKIDEKFYEDMINHKAKRLENRSSLMQNTSMVKKKSNEADAKKIRKQSMLHHSIDDKILSFSQKQSISAEQYQDQEIEKKQVKPLDMKYSVFLLKKLGRLLVDALQQARYYGIENKTNIYKAFWKEQAPYNKSGSYAFYKAIQKGDLQGVKKFIVGDPDYVYERDQKGRSPLMYAVCCNHTDIILYLLTCDVEINKKNSKQRTPLYYAIKNKNVLVVKKLLQAGAIPWSKNNCSLKFAMQKANNAKILTLVKNARKIGIVVQMQPTKPQKIEMWKKLKDKIVENNLIAFEEED